MIEAEEAEVHLSDFMDGVGDVVLWGVGIRNGLSRLTFTFAADHPRSP